MGKYFFVLRLLLTVLVSLILLELVMRVCGFAVSQPARQLLQNIEPEHSFETDPLVGFQPVPNTTVRFEYQTGHVFTATHTQDRTRLCDRDSGIAEPRIEFYGCSFFYGFGLNDHEVFSAVLSKSMAGVRFRNHAVFGQSLVSSYLKLKRQIEQSDKPDLAVVSYASFYLERNVFSPSYRKKILGKWHKLGDNLKYGYCRVDSENKIQFQIEGFEYQPFWSSQYSVLSNKIEAIIEFYQYQSMNPEQADKLIIDLLVSLCEKNNVPLVFAVMTNDPYTISTKKYFAKRSIVYVDIHINYLLEEFNLMPHDNHPNAKAHAYYAIKLKEFLEQY